MYEIKWFVFYPILDEILSGTERRFSQENFNYHNRKFNSIKGL